MKYLPTKNLPETYQLINRIDLRENFRLALSLNIAAIPLFFGFSWLFLKITNALRPDSIELWGVLGDLRNGVVILLAVIIIIILHELTHGFFFWYFTRTRPKFAFKFVYAYASSPNWYIPRNQYLLIGLSPLILLSIFGFVLIQVLPIYWVAVVYIMITFNAAGAVGDIMICGWLLTKPRQFYIRDEGDAVQIFAP
jgi:hypothetical protein